jgi:hypothetical protein
MSRSTSSLLLENLTDACRPAESHCSPTPSKLPGGQHRLAEASTPTLTHRNECRGRTPGQSEHILAESALEHCQVQASRTALISTVPVDTARAQPGNGVTGSADQKLPARCTVCRNYAMTD